MGFVFTSSLVVALALVSSAVVTNDDACPIETVTMCQEAYRDQTMSGSVSMESSSNNTMSVNVSMESSVNVTMDMESSSNNCSAAYNFIQCLTTNCTENSTKAYTVNATDIVNSPLCQTHMECKQNFEDCELPSNFLKCLDVGLSADFKKMYDNKCGGAAAGLVASWLLLLATNMFIFLR